MADTMEFGPEWLRSLPENSQSSGSRFNKTAKRRYGREEMLAFCKDTYTPPAHLRKFAHIFREETQPPISLQPMSEDEERVMTNGVNSQIGLRTGRGGPVARGIGRGGGVERGRGRGRGRGESYGLRGPAAENGDIGGGFSRLRGPAKDSWDGWEDLRKGERGFGRPYEDVGRGEGHPRFSRSVSHENWRDRGGEDDDDDWRKPANRDRWGTRTHWREPASRGGVDFDRRNGAFSRGRGFESDDRGRRQGESRDFDELADDGADDLGALDSRGAFISPREDHRERTHKSDHHHHTTEDHHQKWNRKPPLAENEKDTNFERRKPSHPSPPPHSTNSGDTPSPTTKSDTKSPPGKQDDNAASSIAVVTVASVMPSMPQGMTLTNIISDEKTEAKNATATSMTDENALKWFYTDPQDEIQGPFTGEQMAQWFSAGFFNLNLLVKRGCDHQFQPLRDLMKQCGHVPFLPGPSRPPVTQMTLPTEPSNAVTAGPAAAVIAAVTGATQPTLPANTLAPSLPFSLSLGGIGVGVGGGASADNFAAQQYIIQNQIVQHHTGMKELYMQTLAQLQKQETFARLDPAQQQQLCMQVIQANPMMPQLMQQLQHLQLLQQGLTAPSGATVTTATAAVLSSLPQQTSTDTTMPTSTPSLQRSVSQPSARGEVEEDVASIWGSLPPSKGWTGSQPSSVWDLDNVPTVKPVQSHLDTNTQEKTTATLAYLMEEEKEKLRREQEEVRRQAEALQRERERMEREKEEFERQRQLQIQRVEEIRKQAEEEKRKLEIEEMERKKREKEEEQRRKMQEQEEEEERRRNLEKEEERRRIQQKEEEGKAKKQEKEEEERRKKQQKEEQRRKNEEEEERKKKSEEQKKKEEQLKKKEEEKRKKEDKRKQQEEERQKKQEEARRKKEVEEKAQQEKQQQEEFLRQLEAEKQAEAAEKKQKEFQRQQMEALQQLQQKQALHITELPSTVSWARQSTSQGHAGPSRTLTDIQQEEERLRQQQQSEELARQQAEQLELQLLQQQQQQKSWGKNGKRQQPQRGKTLMEIQQEEERQLQKEQHKVHQRQQHQAKSLSLSQAAAWGGSSSSSASSAAPWNSSSSSSQASSVWGSVDAPSSGIWGASEPSLPTRGGPGKKSGRDSNKTQQMSSEFPALRSEKSHNSSRQQGAKSLPGKSKKEEEAVQRLFKETPEEKDEMTMWTEAYLESMNFQFSVPTFVNLLQSVDCTSELRDYVVSYLGEGKRAMEFLKKFIEKRKMCMDKPAVEPEPEEDSIWGPLPTQSSRGASGVRLLNPPRGATMTSMTKDAGGKAKGGKKKKKMQKRDASSLLGFTVHRDPNRTNAGEIETFN